MVLHAGHDFLPGLFFWSGPLAQTTFDICQGQIEAEFFVHHLEERKNLLPKAGEMRQHRVSPICGKQLDGMLQSQSPRLAALGAADEAMR